MKTIVIPFVLCILLSQMCSTNCDTSLKGRYYDSSIIAFLYECDSVRVSFFSQYDHSFLLKTKQFDTIKMRVADEYLKITSFSNANDSVFLSRNQMIQLLFHLDKEHAEKRTHEQVIAQIEEEIMQWRWLLKYVPNTSIGDPLLDLILPKQKNDCEHMALMMSELLNEMGIQTYCEYTPLWQDRPKSHYWCVTTDSLGQLQPFTPPDNNLGEDWESDLKYAGKVYRLESQRNRNTPMHLAKRNEYIPEVFRSDRLTDQTNRYHKTSTIRIHLNHDTENNLAYLCFFDDNEYNMSPVAWGLINHSKHIAIFEQVPHNVLLFPALFERNQLSAIDNPFIVEANDSIKWIIPDGTINMKLYRKYPPKRRLVKAAENLADAVVLGGNDKKGPFDTLERFPRYQLPYPQDLVFKNKTPYHYYKITTLQHKPLNIAEIQLLTKSKTVTQKIKPMELPFYSENDTPYDNDYYCLKGEVLPTGNTVLNAVDGDFLTYTGSSDLIFYFKTPTIVSAIRYLPRNANNVVVKNDDYVLYYFDKGWVEFFSCTAFSNCIQVKNVPGNTLYLLSNLSEGKEELPFYYIDGKQVFINKSNPYD